MNIKYKGRTKIKFVFATVKKDFTVTLKNFRINGNLKITSKKENGVHVPDVYFEENPSINFSAKTSLGHSVLMKLISGI